MTQDFDVDTENMLNLDDAKGFPLEVESQFKNTEENENMSTLDEPKIMNTHINLDFDPNETDSQQNAEFNNQEVFGKFNQQTIQMNQNLSKIETNQKNSEIDFGNFHSVTKFSDTNNKNKQFTHHFGDLHSITDQTNIIQNQQSNDVNQQSNEVTNQTHTIQNQQSNDVTNQTDTIQNQQLNENENHSNKKKDKFESIQLTNVPPAFETDFEDFGDFDTNNQFHSNQTNQTIQFNSNQSNQSIQFNSNQTNQSIKKDEFANFGNNFESFSWNNANQVFC